MLFAVCDAAVIQMQAITLNDIFHTGSSAAWSLPTLESGTTSKEKAL